MKIALFSKSILFSLGLNSDKKHQILIQVEVPENNKDSEKELVGFITNHEVLRVVEKFKEEGKILDSEFKNISTQKDSNKRVIELIHAFDSERSVYDWIKEIEPTIPKLDANLNKYSALYRWRDNNNLDWNVEIVRQVYS